jgi:hypothetical protein
MVRFLPSKLAPRERRALQRLAVEADMADVSPQVKRRLELLGLACKFDGELLITYDGVLVMGRENTVSPTKSRWTKAAGRNAPGSGSVRPTRRRSGTVPRAGFW